MTKARILIVEDELIVAQDLRNRLSALGYDISDVTALGEQAIVLADRLRPDLVIMDIRLKGQMDGIAAAEQIRKDFHLPVVFLTAFSERETIERAKAAEPFGYIIKPFQDHEIQSTIEIALYKHQAEKRLRESERRYAITLASIGDGVIATDAQGGVTFLNPVAERLTGWSLAEANGRPLREIFHIADEQTRQVVEDPVARVLREGRVVGLASHTMLISRDGREISVDDSAAPIIDDHGQITGTVLVFRDVSERRKLEVQMREVQKLESLGVLAGGFAHDFNNLLMAILGNVDLALLKLSPVSPACQHLKEITLASQRAADLCRQMLAYSGKGHFVVKRHDISEIVRGLIQMLDVSVSRKTMIRYSLAEGLPAVESDATQIRQVIMNLITNASEAMGGTTGIITVATGVMECSGTYLSDSYVDDGLPGGTYVTLEVSDTGWGMDTETRSRIFDPFFTTKFTGRGLGMAAVLGIVRGHKGAIKVESKVGMGTTVKILLPAVEWEPA